MDILIDENGSTYTSSGGDILAVTDLGRFLAQYVLMQMRTLPGELLEHPDFGVGIELFVGKKNSRKLGMTIKKLIEEKLNRYAIVPFTVRVTPLSLTELLIVVFGVVANNVEEISRFTLNITATDVTFTVLKTRPPDKQETEIFGYHRLNKNPYIDIE